QDVASAYESGLINGRDETHFAPDANLTYAEAVKLAACMNQMYYYGYVDLESTGGICIRNTWTTATPRISFSRTTPGISPLPGRDMWRSLPTPCRRTPSTPGMTSPTIRSPMWA
ncbi:MAG: S-layer homology domain-containing protein, partial [Clostridia bacterium]|nr:S-layer homology domain-containing protein [Clostridia bacterium]